jgi:hypothetical protein
MKKVITFFILMTAGLWAACPDSPAGYGYCSLLTADNTEVTGSSAHTDFPALFVETHNDLRTTGNGGYVVDGEDFRFQIGDTVLDYDFISYNETTGELKVWLKVPSLDDAEDTLVYVYYGKAGASGEPDADTWDGFNAVYHLQEDSSTVGAGGIVDSANGNNGTDVGDPPQVSGVMGLNAMDFDGSAEYVTSIADDVTLNAGANSTFSVWINVDNWGVEGDAYLLNIFGDESASPPTIIFRVGSQGDIAYQKRIGINFHDGSSHDVQSTVDLNLDTWTLIHVTTDGTNARFYYDGALDSTVSYTITPTNKSNDWGIGEFLDQSNRRWDGMLQEIRYSSSVRSADWITTEFNNQTTPGDLWSVGAAQAIVSSAPTFQIHPIIGE